MMNNDNLIIQNMKLVYYTYEKLYKSWFVISNREDLISEGYIGLIKAARTFNGKK